MRPWQERQDAIREKMEQRPSQTFADGLHGASCSRFMVHLTALDGAPCTAWAACLHTAWACERCELPFDFLCWLLRTPPLCNLSADMTGFHSLSFSPMDWPVRSLLQSASGSQAPSQARDPRPEPPPVWVELKGASSPDSSLDLVFTHIPNIPSLGVHLGWCSERAAAAPSLVVR